MGAGAKLLCRRRVRLLPGEVDGNMGLPGRVVVEVAYAERNAAALGYCDIFPLKENIPAYRAGAAGLVCRSGVNLDCPVSADGWTASEPAYSTSRISVVGGKLLWRIGQRWLLRCCRDAVVGDEGELVGRRNSRPRVS